MGGVSMAKKKQIETEISNVKDIIDILKKIGYEHDTATVFSDFVTICACTISNSVDPIHKEEREETYLSIVSKYSAEELNIFVKGFANLVLLAEKYATTCGPRDILGMIMEELGLTSERTSQFFTPENICVMMAKMMLVNPDKAIEEKGYITLYEPCSGSGRMVLASATVLKEVNYNYCSQILVMATDIDLRCAMMTYIQLSLYGIPAIVKHQNSLSMETWSRWYTPVYLWKGWCWREGFIESAEDKRENEMLKLASEPMYATMRSLFGYGNEQVQEIHEENVVVEKESYNFHFDFDFGNIKEAMAKKMEAV